ncbi:MAG: terminase small subunit [Anaerobutyricum hallii]
MMARARDPNRDKAFEIYKKYKGNIDLVEIANQLKISSGTVRGWKSKDKWTEKMNGTFQTNTERSIQKKNKKKKVVVEEVDKVMKNDELTDKQRLFCIYYVKCFNATKAYQKAYECSYETAMANGYKMLRNTQIKSEIHNLKQTRLNREFLTEEDIFQKYIDIAFADITDFLEFTTEEVPVMSMYGPVKVENSETGQKEILKERSNVVRFKDSSMVDGTIISEVKQGRDGASIKLADRMKALQWLSEHMDLATEEQKARIGVLKARAKVDDKVSVEDKVAKLFEAIGGELDAESE